MIEFPISGVETFWWLPPLVAFVIAFAAGTGGLSGAFMVLPFQVSILGFTGPAVTPTNLIFNVIATPAGAYRFFREGRMLWPLFWTLIAGTVPGVIAGSLIRINYLPDPSHFRIFAGIILAFIGIKLIHDILTRTEKLQTENKEKFRIGETEFSLKKITFTFNGNIFTVKPIPLFAISLVIGIIGGIYGFGGGALLVPVMVTFLRLPVYAISGAALLETFVTSLTGVVSYSVLSMLHSATGNPAIPDWHLGGLMGIGGALGIYFGARVQKHLPSRLIKSIIAVCIIFIAVRYILAVFS